MSGSRKNWFKCFCKSAAWWSSRSTSISLSELDDLRTNDLREGTVLHLLGCDSKVIAKWGWWRLSGMQRICSWFGSVVYEFFASDNNQGRVCWTVESVLVDYLILMVVWVPFVYLFDLIAEVYVHNK